jgi:hypothetical protein
MSFWEQAFSTHGKGDFLGYWREYFDEPTLSKAQMKQYLDTIKNQPQLEQNERERQSRLGKTVTVTAKKIDLFKVETITPPENAPPAMSFEEIVQNHIPGDAESGVYYKVTMWDEALIDKLKKNRTQYKKYVVGSTKTPQELLQNPFERECAPSTYIDQHGNIWERQEVL